MLVLVTILFLIILLVGLFFIIRPVQGKSYDGISYQKVSRIAGSIAVALSGFVLLLMSISSVGATEVGVPITLGKPGSPIGPGPHLVLPITEVRTLDVKTQVVELDDDNEIKTITSDRIQVPVDVSVFYKVDSGTAPTLLLTVGEDYANKIIRPLTRSAVYDGGSTLSSENIQNQRAQYEETVFNTLKPQFADRGITLEKVEIRKVQVPDKILENAQAKINAEEQLKRAKIDADTKVVDARAQAEANRILADSINKNPNVICQQFVEGLRKGEIKGPIYVNPCGGAAGPPIILQRNE